MTHQQAEMLVGRVCEERDVQCKGLVTVDIAAITTYSDNALASSIRIGTALNH